MKTIRHFMTALAAACAALAATPPARADISIGVVASGSGAAMPHKGWVERGDAKGRICQTHGASRDSIRVGGVDVEGSYVSSGPAVVAAKLPDSNLSKALGMKYIAEYEKVYTAADHFGYTPETGVLLKIVGGEWQVAAK